MKTEAADFKSPAGFTPLNWWQAALLVFGAAVCFHAAYTLLHPGLLALLIIGYVACVVQLARLRTTRQAFYTGMLTGFLCFAPQLGFFWRIFGPAAIALWSIMALWLALFIALSHVALVRLGPKRAVWLVPFLWTGLEYFRSELYYLKFSWLNVGYGLSDWKYPIFQFVGVYGAGFYAATCAALLLQPRLKWLALCGATFIFASYILFGSITYAQRPPNLQIAGIQLEFPNESQVKRALDSLIGTRTNLDLIVLSEYTLDETPSAQLKQWCRDHQKFLIVGGKEPAPDNNFTTPPLSSAPTARLFSSRSRACRSSFSRMACPRRNRSYGIRRGAKSASASVTT